MRNDLRLCLSAAVASVGLVSSAGFAATATWDGGSTVGQNWGFAENWVGDVLPTFDNQLDVIFQGSTRPGTILGDNRTVRSITFDTTTQFVVRPVTSESAPVNLTLDGGGAGASITVLQNSASGHLIGDTGGNLVLADNLRVTHRGTLGNIIFDRNITGTGNITFNGLSNDNQQMLLRGNNTFNGNVILEQGILTLFYGNTSTSYNTSKIPDTSTVFLGNGLFRMGGSPASRDHLEVVNNTVLTDGQVRLERSGTNTSIYHAGAITGIGSLTIDNSALARTLASTPLFDGLLPRNINVGNSFATLSGESIVETTSYTDINRLGGVIANGPTSQVRIVTGGSSGDITLATSGTTTINTLTQQSGDGPAVVDLGGNTLRMGTWGGILLTNAALGNFTIQNGTLTTGGSDNNPGELYIHNRSTTRELVVSATIANNGSGPLTLNKSNWGSMTLTGVNTYTGETRVVGGTLKLDGAGSIDNSPVIDVRTGATFDVSTVTGGYQLKGGQTLKGKGRVVGNVTVNAGATVSPGMSVGTFTAGNNITFSSNSNLNIEIESASSFDKLVVTGTSAAVFNGNINVTFLNSFVPANGDVFNVVTGTNVTGAVGNLNGSGKLPVPGGTFDVEFSAAGLLLKNFTGAISFLKGDMNNDNAVNNQDIAPFVLALTNYPQYQIDFPGLDGVARGDINLDTVLNNQDIAPFVALLTGGPSPVSDADLAPLMSLVPEPASLSLLALGGLLGLRRRRA